MNYKPEQIAKKSAGSPGINSRLPKSCLLSGFIIGEMRLDGECANSFVGSVVAGSSDLPRWGNFGPCEDLQGRECWGQEEKVRFLK